MVRGGWPVAGMCLGNLFFFFSFNLVAALLCSSLDEGLEGLHRVAVMSSEQLSRLSLGQLKLVDLGIERSEDRYR